jgi:hypothetical protein
MIEEIQNSIASLTGHAVSAPAMSGNSLTVPDDLPSHDLLEQIGFESPDQNIPLDQIKVDSLETAQIVISYLKGQLEATNSRLEKLATEFKRVHPNADI